MHLLHNRIPQIKCFLKFSNIASYTALLVDSGKCICTLQCGFVHVDFFKFPLYAFNPPLRICSPAPTSEASVSSFKSSQSARIDSALNVDDIALSTRSLFRPCVNILNLFFNSSFDRFCASFRKLKRSSYASSIPRARILPVFCRSIHSKYRRVGRPLLSNKPSALNSPI